MQCPTKPLATHVLFVGLPSYAACVDLFQKAKRQLGEVLSAYEFLDNECVVCARENADIACPISADHNFYVLIGTTFFS